MARVFVGITTTASQYLPVQSCKLIASEVLDIASAEFAEPSFNAPSGSDGKYWVIIPIEDELVWANFEGDGDDGVGWPCFGKQASYYEIAGGLKPSIYVP